MNGFSIKIRNSSLERIGNDCHENSTKFLGIYVDENLTWKKHVKFVNKKIANALFSIKQVKHILPFESLRTLYYSLIQSHLSYGIIVWGNADKSVVKSTFLLQKRAIRVINNALYNRHTDPLFRSSRILKLDDLFEYQSVIFMTDYMHDKLPLSFKNMFTINRNMPNARTTRQSNMLNIGRCDSQFSRKLPLYHLPALWNKWTKVISENLSRRNIKRLVKSTIFEIYANNVTCDNIWCKQCFPR